MEKEATFKRTLKSLFKIRLLAKIWKGKEETKLQAKSKILIEHIKDIMILTHFLFYVLTK